MVNPDLQEIIADVVVKMGKKSSDEKHTSESSWKDDSSSGQIQGARNHCKRQETTA
jgi:hypothetical protein